MEPVTPCGAVRLAGPADLDLIDGIEAESFDRDRFPRRNLARMLRGGRTRFLLAGRAGYLALSFRAGSRVARIYSLAVRPADRGRGIADRLVSAAGTLAAQHGAISMRLEVRASNTAAQRLYHRHGFRLRRRLEAYYEDGEAALQMDLPLAAGETHTT
jgi:ribosomal-protein-alanine N-acetyltransferase